MKLYPSFQRRKIEIKGQSRGDGRRVSPLLGLKENFEFWREISDDENSFQGIFMKQRTMS